MPTAVYKNGIWYDKDTNAEIKDPVALKNIEFNYQKQFDFEGKEKEQSRIKKDRISNLKYLLNPNNRIPIDKGQREKFTYELLQMLTSPGSSSPNQSTGMRSGHQSPRNIGAFKFGDDPWQTMDQFLNPGQPMPQSVSPSKGIPRGVQTYLDSLIPFMGAGKKLNQFVGEGIPRGVQTYLDLLIPFMGAGKKLNQFVGEGVPRGVQTYLDLLIPFMGAGKKLNQFVGGGSKRKKQPQTQNQSNPMDQIQVISPEGVVGFIPRADLAQAMEEGYQLAG